ncbi:MAG TPA: tetratricopeptide repeat protein [Chthoniobacterales bacterium]|nr:tetratricopeptide repeat protein [Chthoniobacterales bacterium]
MNKPRQRSYSNHYIESQRRDRLSRPRQHHYNDAQYGQAVSDYSEAIRLKPDYAEAYDDRGDAYGKLGRNLEAAKDHKKAKELKGR